MSTSGATSFPSYSNICDAHELPGQTQATRHLVWYLEGPLETNVFIMENPKNQAGPRQPYFQQTLAGTSWHPFSQEPLTEKKISSITVKMNLLTQREDAWLDYHLHADPDDGICIYKEIEEGEEEDEEGTGLKLVSCCGDDRPTDTRPLVVRASTQPYVTVHDYLSAVHPWLMSLRPTILEAWVQWAGTPLPADKKLMVNYNGLDRLTIEQEDEWINHQEWRFKIEIAPPMDHETEYQIALARMPPDMAELLRTARWPNQDRIDAEERFMERMGREPTEEEIDAEMGTQP